MTPKGTPDPEYPTSNSRKGDRKDKKNLIDVWMRAKPVRSLCIIIMKLYYNIIYFIDRFLCSYSREIHCYSYTDLLLWGSIAHLLKWGSAGYYISIWGSLM